MQEPDGAVGKMTAEQEVRCSVVVTTHTYHGSLSQLVVFALLAVAVIFGVRSVILSKRNYDKQDP